MPPLPPVPNVIRSTFKQQQAGDLDILNRCFWSYSGTTSQVSMGAFATALAAHWHANIHPLQASDMELVSVECVDLASDTGPLAFFPAGTNGALVSGANPAGAAAVLQFEIDRRYRGGKPKMFIGGLEQVQLSTPQLWTSGFVASLIEAWLAVQAATLEVEFGGITTITGQVNVSYYSGFTNGVGPTGRAKVNPNLRVTPVVDPIVGVDVNPAVASQRRRNETP